MTDSRFSHAAVLFSAEMINVATQSVPIIRLAGDGFVGTEKILFQMESACEMPWHVHP